MKTLNEIRGKKKAVFTFGRMNPPTIGHEKLIEKVISEASRQGADPFIYISKTQDKKKNPLSFQEKIKFLKHGIPTAKKYVSNNTKVRTPFDAINDLISMGYTDVVMVVGQDRVKEFQNVIGKFVNHPDASKNLALNTFKVISAGNRDPDSDGVAGISSSKMREAASNNQLNIFLKGIPSKMDVKTGRKMFNTVRSNMSIKEYTEEICRERTQINKTMKTFKQYFSEQDEKPTSRAKARHDREKENLKQKHSDELEVAREKEFKDSEREKKAKEREKELQARLS